MKKICLLLFCLLCYKGVHAQEKTINFTIKGFLVDSINNKPLPYVTVLLTDTASRQSINTLSKTNGSFKFNIPADKDYQLAFTFIGYKKRILFFKANKETDLGDVKLSPLTNQLKEVNVTSVKPVITQDIDRINYNVQNDPENKMLNVLDMLRKVPFISVDANDNILFKGTTKFKILINGRASSLFVHAPSDVLRTMSSSNIKKIEVITTPPSKYDAEGLTGIINVVLKKQIDDAYNASINLHENTVNGPAAGVSLTLKEGKLGLLFNAGAKDQIDRRGNTLNTLQTFSPQQSLFTQSGDQVNSGNNKYSSIELSYEIDSLNLITGMIDYSSGKSSFSNDQTSGLFDSDGLLIQSYQQNNLDETKWRSTDFTINYQLGFKRNKDQILTASYKYSTSPGENKNNIGFLNTSNFKQPDYRQQNNSGIKENTIQLDYFHPLKKINIEGGVKAILRNNFSDFDTQTLDSLGNYIGDLQNSNRFNYEQNVYSVYNSYQLNLNNWGFKAGIRIERTSVHANFLSEDTSLNQSYNNVIPSIAILRKLKNNVSLNFGFTNRIERPGIYELNPFVNLQNPKFVYTGNPNLRPVLNHNIDFGFSKYGKGSFNLSLSYSFANNTIQNVTKLKDSVAYTTYQNIGSNKITRGNVSFNYPLTKKLRFSINGEVSYVQLKGYFNSVLYQNNGVQGFGFSELGYQVTDTWRTGLNGAWYSSNVLLQGKSNDYFFTSMNTTKDILKRKVTLFFYVNNILQKNRDAKSYVKDPAFYESNVSTNPYRTIGFGFYYHFGNFNKEIKKNRRGINNDDVKKHESPNS